MNRGILESSPVQQLMAAGNPNWWSINGGMRPPPPLMAHHHHHHHHQPSPQMMSPFFHPPPPPSSLPNLIPQYLPSPTSSSSSSSPSLPSNNSNNSNSIPSWLDNQELPPESWTLSQLLLGGVMVGEDEKLGMTHHTFQAKKLENWEEQVLNHHQASMASASAAMVDVKQESCGNNGYVYASHHHNQVMPNSPPNKSCITTTTSLSNNSSMLDFSSNNNGNNNNNNKKVDGRHPPPDRSSECNSNENGGSAKKPRVQPSSSSSTQSTLKVRKEKLGGRIAALHQLVSPFGKTDTASVLSEAIGYIRFLQSQIEALSSPYFGNASGNMRHQQHMQGERNSIFPEDPGQLLNDHNNCMKRKGASVDQQEPNEEQPKKDLRTRGLCLVPISCTLQVGSDNGADYWAPALGAGFR